MLNPLILPRSTGDTAYPPLPAPPDTSAYGERIQRSMALMATSAPAKRNTVRILYYGQSIVGQRWSEQVDVYLRETYPHHRMTGPSSLHQLLGDGPGPINRNSKTQPSAWPRANECIDTHHIALRIQ